MTNNKIVEQFVNQYEYTCKFSEDDNAWIAEAEEFPGILAHGETELDAVILLKEGLSHLMVSILEEGEVLPYPKRMFN